MFCRIRCGWHSKVKTWLELIHSRVQTKPTAMVAMMNKNAGFKNEFWTYLYKPRRQGFRSVWLYFKRFTIHFYLNVNAASRCLSFLTNTSLDDTPPKKRARIDSTKACNAAGAAAASKPPDQAHWGYRFWRFISLDEKSGLVIKKVGLIGIPRGICWVSKETGHGLVIELGESDITMVFSMMLIQPDSANNNGVA